MSSVAANPILEGIRAKALEFASEEENLLEIIDYWSSISDLSKTKGWEVLLEIVDVAVATHLENLVGEIDSRNIAFLQAHVASLRFLKNIPATAGMQLEAARLRQSDMATRKQEFVEYG